MFLNASLNMLIYIKLFIDSNINLYLFLDRSLRGERFFLMVMVLDGSGVR